MSDDGIDRSNVPAGTLEVAVERMHHLTMMAFVQSVASFNSEEVVGEILSTQGLGGYDLFVGFQRKDESGEKIAGTSVSYQLRLGPVIDKLIRTCVEHDAEYDLESEKALADRQRREHKEKERA